MASLGGGSRGGGSTQPPSSPFTRSQARAAVQAAESSSQRAGITRDCAPKCITSHYPACIHEVFAYSSPRKQVMLRDLGIQGLPHVPNHKIDRNFSLWLLSRVKVDPLELQLGNGRWVPITEYDVERIMGIRAGGLEITSADSEVPSSVTTRVKNILAGGVISLTSLREVLEMDFERHCEKVDEEMYKVAAVLYAFAYLLECKTRTPEVPKSLMNAVSMPSKLNQYNWARFVLRGIKYGALKAQNDVARGTATVVLAGCLLFLQVFYLEKIDFGRWSVAAARAPVIANYRGLKIKELIDMDCAPGRPGLPEWFGWKKDIRADVYPIEKLKGPMVREESVAISDAVMVEAGLLIDDQYARLTEDLVTMIGEKMQKDKEELLSLIAACLRKNNGGCVECPGAGTGDNPLQIGVTTVTVDATPLGHIGSSTPCEELTGVGNAEVVGGTSSDGATESIQAVPVTDTAAGAPMDAISAGLFDALANVEVSQPASTDGRPLPTGDAGVQAPSGGPENNNPDFVAKRQKLGVDGVWASPTTSVPDDDGKVRALGPEAVKVVICQPWLLDYLASHKSEESVMKRKEQLQLVTYKEPSVAFRVDT